MFSFSLSKSKRHPYSQSISEIDSLTGPINHFQVRHTVQIEIVVRTEQRKVETGVGVKKF